MIWIKLFLNETTHYVEKMKNYMENLVIYFANAICTKNLGIVFENIQNEIYSLVIISLKDENLYKIKNNYYNMNNKIKEANKSMNSFYENITYEEYMEMENNNLWK